MEAQDKPEVAIPQTETKPLVKSFNGEGKNVILGITGTSGAIYGLRMLRALIKSDFNVDLILTEFAHYTIYRECGVELKPGNVQNIFRPPAECSRELHLMIPQVQKSSE